MLEGTFRDAAAVADTIRRFSSAGYRAVVVVLAVPVERSRLDCLLRSLGSNGTPGRWTPPSAHDTYYERLPATLATLQAVRELDQITITTRDGVDLYTNQRGTDRRWQHPVRAHDALTAHRDQSMLSGEAQTWLRQYRLLLDQLDTHRLDPRALNIYTPTARRRRPGHGHGSRRTLQSRVALYRSAPRRPRSAHRPRQQRYRPARGRPSGLALLPSLSGPVHYRPRTGRHAQHPTDHGLPAIRRSALLKIRPNMGRPPAAWSHTASSRACNQARRRPKRGVRLAATS